MMHLHINGFYERCFILQVHIPDFDIADGSRSTPVIQQEIDRDPIPVFGEISFPGTGLADQGF